MDLERVLVFVIPTVLQLTNKPTPYTFPTCIQFKRWLSKVWACPVTTNGEIDVSFFVWMCICLLILMSQCSHHVIKGEVSTLAGSADIGDANGNGNRARFNEPKGLWFDEKHQSLLVCDYFNDKLKRVSLKGMLNIAISFFSTYHLSFISSNLVVIFILAKFKQQAMYRQCVAYLGQPVWQLQTQLF